MTTGILKTLFLHLPLLLLYSGVSTACESHGHFARVRRSESSIARSALPSQQEQILLDSFSNVTIAEWNFYYTHGAHLAGKNLTQAQWTAGKWSSYGVPAHLAEYEVYLNYPESHSLSLTNNGSVFHARLAEDEIPEDPTTTWPNRIPTFHGYSFSGNATAEYVYVGRGGASDFKRLIALGVDLKGKIALAKYGGPFRGLKVKNAQEHEMVGAILFTDPGNDGNVTVENGYLPYPKGPARQPSSVQRGSVEFLNIYPGDPTTPGVASLPGVNRTGVITDVTPTIPSIPVSQLDIQPLLKALDGYGKTAKEVNLSGWTGLLDTKYSTGPAPGAVVSLSNVMKSSYNRIWDAIGFINGTIEDEVIVIGNHRDAWIIGGAADPNSGSAVLVELAKAFGKLQETGWKPKRTMYALPSFLSKYLC
jgi:N-acetylated-alpha-linked acidic dipeptidase